ncbi:JAB domain-containing protein [Roseomonas sp. HF4]|uniref:JAB domain-containing protein n=1 Tax=Roseomonas sp. HF4 TaxID=2562313 RepID=UPI0014852DC1|nr:JAB domain-containing protein [Roseomonas sp. HF4]
MLGLQPPAPAAAPPVPPAPVHRAAACAPAGADALSEDREVLFAVLSHCLGWMEGADAAEAVLGRYGGLAAAAAAEEAELAALPELGEAGAAALKAVHAAARHLAAAALDARPALRSTGAILAYARARGAGLAVGETRALFLDARERLIVDEVVACPGTEAGAPARVLRRALALQAGAMILLRDAGAAPPAPAEADLDLARRVGTAGAALGVRLHDLLVVGRAAHASLRAAGLLAAEA